MSPSWHLSAPSCRCERCAGPTRQPGSEAPERGNARCPSIRIATAFGLAMTGCTFRHVPSHRCLPLCRCEERACERRGNPARRLPGVAMHRAPRPGLLRHFVPRKDSLGGRSTMSSCIVVAKSAHTRNGVPLGAKARGRCNAGHPSAAQPLSHPRPWGVRRARQRRSHLFHRPDSLTA